MTSFARVESSVGVLEPIRKRLARVETRAFASRHCRLSSMMRPANTNKTSFFFLSCSVIPSHKTVVYWKLMSCSQYSSVFLLTKNQDLLNRNPLGRLMDVAIGGVEVRSVEQR